MLIGLWRAAAYFLILLILISAGAGCAGKPRIGRLTVLVSGYVEGYLRNCGCSAGQAGGELRKARIVKMERAEAQKPKPADRGLVPGFILLDIGNFSNSRTKVTRAEAAGVVKSMSRLDYDAVGIGQYELTYPQQDLLALLGNAGLPLVAANLTFIAPPSGDDHSTELNKLIKPYRLVTFKNGYAVGVIHVIDPQVAARQGDKTGFTLTDPVEAATAIMQQHGREAATWILTIANARNDEEDRAKLAAVPGITLLIGYRRTSAMADTSSAVGELPRLIAPPFERAKDVVRITTGFSTEGKVEAVISEEVMIPDSIMPDEYVQSLIDEIQPELERLANADAEVEDRPGVHPRYVGFSACNECHAPIVSQLSASKHIMAYETLKLKDQHRSAACLPCHVVGYNQAGGWNVLKNNERPEMRGVQCENCHGAGEYHVSAMKGEKAPPDLKEGGRSEKGIVRADEKTCLTCHDSPNSPHFDFATYWAKIKH